MTATTPTTDLIELLSEAAVEIANLSDRSNPVRLRLLAEMKRQEELAKEGEK